MNISIFDLYQSPSAAPHWHAGPYVYHSLSQSPLPSPDSCFLSEPLTPLKSTAVSLHPCLPTRKRQESLDWDFDAMIEALREGIGSRRKVVKGHRGSNALKMSHSFAENQIYWNELRKKMSKRPDYQHRRHLSGTSKPPLPALRPPQFSLSQTKLSRIDFSRKAHREEALRALGFSMRSRGKAAKLREILDRQESKARARVSPVPLEGGGRRLNASHTLPKPARFKAFLLKSYPLS